MNRLISNLYSPRYEESQSDWWDVQAYNLHLFSSDLDCCAAPNSKPTARLHKNLNFAEFISGLSVFVRLVADFMHFSLYFYLFQSLIFHLIYDEKMSSFGKHSSTFYFPHWNGGSCQIFIIAQEIIGWKLKRFKWGWKILISGKRSIKEKLFQRQKVERC